MPVATVERGKSVHVAKDLVYEVADHDFCKISLAPSVTLKAKIPESIEGSFYEGKVLAALKENCFEPSSSFRHLAEYNSHEKPIRWHYHNGGPDNNVRHMRNKLANIAYFMNRDLDFICNPRHKTVGKIP